MTTLRRPLRRPLIASLLVGLACWSSIARAQEPPAAVRRFRLEYGATVTDLTAGSRVQVWLPVPQSDGAQQVRRVAEHLPAKATEHVEPRYGNRLLHFETVAPASGRIPVKVIYRVERREVRGLAEPGPAASRRLTASQRDLFLAANRRVPLDGKPRELLRDITLPRDPLALGRTLYDRVDEHMKYDKSRPGYGRGDAVWACDSRTGNCTDFHSLFIALARSEHLPARFEIGFPLPAERGRGEIGGYHCWGLFHIEGRGWVPVDISEADKQPERKDYYFGNLTENRVAFSTGRDLKLVPPQAGPPLNYFVYPYVEMEGRPLAAEHIDLLVRYQDL